MKTPQKARQREQKVLDFNIVFHNKRINVWNQPMKSRGPSPEKQERMKDQEDIQRQVDTEMLYPGK